jgi:hypothetical protein
MEAPPTAPTKSAAPCTAFSAATTSPQQQYQKKLLRPETQSALSENLRKILAIDDPLNDELSSVGSGQSGFMK